MTSARQVLRGDQRTGVVGSITAATLSVVVEDLTVEASVAVVAGIAVALVVEDLTVEALVAGAGVAVVLAAEDFAVAAAEQ